MAIRILLADDHGVVRHGLRVALEQEPDLEVVAEAENGDQAVELCARHTPEVVLMDIHMPGISGTEATRRITAQSPHTKVLALSMYRDQHYVRGMLEAGAAGYLLKNCAFEELTSAIRSVVQGKSHLSQEVAGSVIKMALEPGSAAREEAPALSPREREVVRWVAAGLTSKQIAQRLCLSENTVESHRRRAMKKLGLRSVAELTKFALREGLASLDE